VEIIDLAMTHAMKSPDELCSDSDDSLDDRVRRQRCLQRSSDLVARSTGQLVACPSSDIGKRCSKVGVAEPNLRVPSGRTETAAENIQ
jgi:hypothetical protein